jgi:hypothetical protein
MSATNATPALLQGWLNWKWYFDARMRERAVAEWTAFGVILAAVLLFA